MKRHHDAYFIQQGACNPIAVAKSLVAAIDEVRDGGYDMPAIEKDPAVRLICHQLAHLLGVYSLFNNQEDWQKCMDECEAKQDEEVQYRCTRQIPYGPGCPGYTNPTERQGYYIMARSREEALAKLKEQFPSEDISTFTAHLWKE